MSEIRDIPNKVIRAMSDMVLLYVCGLWYNKFGPLLSTTKGSSWNRKHVLGLASLRRPRTGEGNHFPLCSIRASLDHMEEIRLPPDDRIRVLKLKLQSSTTMKTN
jgi:hypothetical protein